MKLKERIYCLTDASFQTGNAGLGVVYVNSSITPLVKRHQKKITNVGSSTLAEIEAIKWARELYGESVAVYCDCTTACHIEKAIHVDRTVVKQAHLLARQALSLTKINSTKLDVALLKSFKKPIHRIPKIQIESAQVRLDKNGNFIWVLIDWKILSHLPIGTRALKCKCGIIFAWHENTLEPVCPNCGNNP